jgi:Rrf2 family iron-sulfur cluster assembly transcriptional regulator
MLISIKNQKKNRKRNLDFFNRDDIVIHRFYITHFLHLDALNGMGRKTLKLGTKGQYAVMAMAHLNVYAKKGPISLTEISQSQKLPLPYLEQLFAKLRKSGLVTSVRGQNGGYILGKSATDITIYDILQGAQEKLKTTRCNPGPIGCQGLSTQCVAHNLWIGLENHITGYLQSKSLHELCHREHREKCTP